MHNLTYIAQHFIEWTTQGYSLAVGAGVFWVLLFIGISGYFYLKNQSVVVWAVIILVFIVAFGDALIGVDIVITLFHILIALAFTGLLLLFVSKYRR